MPCLSYLDDLWNRRFVAIQLLFVECCFQDLFKIARFGSAQVVHQYSCTDTTQIWKRPSFILSERSFHINNSMSIAAHTFSRCMLTSLSVDEILLPRYQNWAANFRDLSLLVAIAPSSSNAWTFVCVCVYVEDTTSCSLLQAIQLGFGLGRCIIEKN